MAVAPLAETEEWLGPAVEALSGGGVVAVPTDTVYGLATTLSAASRLYQVSSPRIPAENFLEPSIESLLIDRRRGAETLMHRVLRQACWRFGSTECPLCLRRVHLPASLPVSTLYG